MSLPSPEKDYDMEKRDGPRHDLKVDHNSAFEGVKVKSLADGYNASPDWKVATPPEQPSRPQSDDLPTP